MNTQQTEALRALAEAVKGWNSTYVWPHEDDEEIAILGQINDDGEKYPVAEINVDTYFREGESIALANFYAAANPAAVLALLDRITELEARHARKYRLLQRGEAMRLGDQFIDDDTVTWHPVWKGLVLAGACWLPSYQPMRREIQESPNGPSI